MAYLPDSDGAMASKMLLPGGKLLLGNKLFSSQANFVGLHYMATPYIDLNN
jgi:hypothetical protein